MPPETRTPPSGPLRGLRVVDCSTVLAGPYCSMLLADLGADVVKVEPPEGDATRGWGPPWQVEPPQGEAGPPAADAAAQLGAADPRAAGSGSPDSGAVLAGPGDAAAGPPSADTPVAPGPADGAADRGERQSPGAVAAYFLAANRNKRSIRLDLRRPAGREVLRRLLAPADVLVENFRPGAFDRLGFDDATLRQLNPRLVHLAISGYGRTGPLAGRPGYDFLVQAQSGLMSITGFADEEGGRPTKVGIAVADVATGLFGAIGVLAALFDRHAGLAAGGAGQRVDVSILESTLAILINQAQNLFVSGSPPKRRGNAHPNIVPYETFRTSDGEIALGAGSERQWGRLCELLGDPALTGDARFATNGGRVEHRDVLRPLLASRFRARTTRDWLASLEAAEIPCAPINDLAAAFADPQVAAREILVDVEHPVMGPIRQVAPPIGLSATPASVRTPPPLLGEHTDEILHELGFDEAEIRQLRTEGVT